VNRRCAKVLIGVISLLQMIMVAQAFASGPVPGFDVSKAVGLISASPDADQKNSEAIPLFTSGPYQYEGMLVRYVLVGYALAGKCHVCALTLVAGIFAENSDGWTLQSVQPDIAEIGAFGALGGKAEAINLGENHLGVMLKVNDMHQGEAETYLMLLAPVDGKILPIWQGVIGTDDTQTLQCLQKSQAVCPQWVSVLDVLSKAKDGWLQLELRTTGLGERDDGSIGDVSRVQLLQFDGSKYSESRR
jgi:hypothetical protein